MLTSCKGINENGKIELTQAAPVHNRTEVIVTFLETKKEEITGRRLLGGLKGKFQTPDDFNEPLDDLKEYMR